jgi:cytidylate kinase
MGTVTIAATFGAGGSVVAPEVAERLGLPLVDRAIPAELAEKLAREVELPEDEVHEGGAVARYLATAVSLSGLYVGVPLSPETRAADDRIAEGEAALRRIADGGGAVILGRAGVFVLRGRPDVLHVRLDASPEARARQVVRHEGLDEETAKRLLKANDRARLAYIRSFHPGERWEDPANYHLVLESTALPLDTCSELIVTAARALFTSLPREVGGAPGAAGGGGRGLWVGPTIWLMAHPHR